MKLPAYVMMAILAAAVQAQAAANWLTDYSQAEAQARESRKPILALFTGSDWCPPCKKLHSEVLTTPEFEKYAAANVVLLEVDFPIKKKQSVEQKKANHELEKKYDIEGYPTMVVINESGKAIGTIEYGLEKPAKFIEKVDKVVRKAVVK
jgi:thioredoxin-related protein